MYIGCWTKCGWSLVSGGWSQIRGGAAEIPQDPP